MTIVNREHGRQFNDPPHPALAAAVVLEWMIVATITTPVAYAAQAAEAVAAGDLATPIHPGAKDEIGRLLAALERMRGALAQAVRDPHGCRESECGRL